MRNVCINRPVGDSYTGAGKQWSHQAYPGDNVHPTCVNVLLNNMSSTLYRYQLGNHPVTGYMAKLGLQPIYTT